MRDRETMVARFAGDPALAVAMKPADVYAWASSTRDDDELPPDVPAQMVAYKFQRLTRHQRHKFVMVGTSNEERAERAFAAGIVEVVGGRFDTAWRPSTVDEKGHVAASWEELEEVGFTPAEMQDVGQRIYAVSELGKGSVPPLVPLPSSALAMDGAAHLYAARSPK